MLLGSSRGEELPQLPPLRTARARFPRMPLKHLEGSSHRTRSCLMHFLHDTHPLPTSSSPQAAPASVSTAIICSACFVGLTDSLVSRHPMKVGPLSCRVMSPEGSTPIHLITRWRSLLSSSFTRLTIGSSHDSLSLPGAIRVYHVPRVSQSGLDPPSSPAVLLSTTGKA